MSTIITGNSDAANMTSKGPLEGTAAKLIKIKEAINELQASMESDFDIVQQKQDALNTLLQTELDSLQSLVSEESDDIQAKLDTVSANIVAAISTLEPDLGTIITNQNTIITSLGEMNGELVAANVNLVTLEGKIDSVITAINSQGEAIVNAINSK